MNPCECRLLEAVLLQERHIVTYVPRSNIPRLIRQVYPHGRKPNARKNA